ncbi:hypothetical protein [Sphingobium yanoikuyae]|jgi:hypothetical protein|uniref:hypothetical protein n=1 Tax=Sphingobium yanoikuyae TaxID=13690 RepID=UPI0004E30167|nr:hypothetical protein [Sphingobium yanoikuyae]KFD25823.1 hypothetical protein IH86_23420 [Sphingobium yanoikuyae]KZC81559.1 hypothetical protein AYR46_07405 [Sphingobium yanoikuyae]MDV3478627.1 hypothetical protein [Sphingobium yanoikuyae]
MTAHQQKPADARIRVILFALWLAVTIPLVLAHVFWRDEVRALSLSLQGNTLSEMFKALRGDGHPILWYLLLRAGHAVMGSMVLPVAAFAIGLTSMALLLWRSPFTSLTLALVVFSHFAAWEYVVMARNYGISMLLMFAFAAAYPRWRDRGIWLVLPLTLLAETNVHSAILAGGLLGVWLTDVFPGKDRIGQWLVRRVLPASLCMLIAVLICFLTVWPTFNDAAVNQTPVTGTRLFLAAIVPGIGFASTLPILPMVAMSLTLAGATLILHGRPFHILAAWIALGAMSLLFTVMYGASDRHRELWIVYLITLFWMRLDRDREEGRQIYPNRIKAVGQAAFTVLLAVYVAKFGITAASQLQAPSSRSYDLAQLIASSADLNRAIAISDPDYALEALPYYSPSTPIWRIRQGGFSTINHFTSHDAKLDLKLHDITQTARLLSACNSRPVLVILQRSPVPGQPAEFTSGYNWTTRYSLLDIAEFLKETEKLKQFGAVTTDESFTVYRLKAKEVERVSVSACRDYRLN